MRLLKKQSPERAVMGLAQRCQRKWRAKAHKSGVLFCVLCALCMVFTAAAPAKAAQSGQPDQNGKPYSYRIRIYAGRQGTIGGGEVLEYTGVAYGSQVQFQQRDVQLFDNSKYYVRGLRKSGVDNSEAQQNPAFTVTEDQDYVVAYGILGDAVSYVINYQDSDGNTLAPSETYYGNVGDKPVIAYLYIEGYRPQAYNLTRTLSENAAENVFTFIYTPISAGGGTTTPPDQNQTQGGGTENPAAPVTPVTPAAPGETGTVVLPPEAIAPAPAPAAPGGAAAPAGPGGADAPAGPGGADAPGPGGADAPGPGGADTPVENVPDENVPLDNTPEDLVDLDDDDVPLANFFNLNSDARILGIPVAAVIVSGAVLIGCVIWLILKKKKKKEREEA